ncbi:MAG: T9SS type A sorting domain-containing protein [bacterium]
MISKLQFFIWIVCIFTLGNRLASQEYWEQIPNDFGERIYSMMTDNQGNIYTGNNLNGIYRISDQTGICSKSLLPNRWVYSLVITKLGNYLAGTNEGVYRSTNSGKDWINMTFQENFSETNSIAIDKDGTIYTANGYHHSAKNAGYILKSTDDGILWNKIFETDLPVFCITIAENGYIFAGTSGLGVYRSTDSGKSWHEINNGLSDFHVKSLFVSNEGYLFIGALAIDSLTSHNSQIYVSTDYGENWKQCYNTNKQILYSFIQNEHGDILASCSQSVMFKSTNLGSNWVEIPGEIGNHSISAMSKYNDIIYAGSDRGNVFKSVDGGESWIKIGMTGCDIYDMVVANNDDFWVSAGWQIVVDIAETSEIHYKQKITGCEIIFPVLEKDNQDNIYISSDCLISSFSCVKSYQYNSPDSLCKNMEVKALCYKYYLGNSILAGTFDGVSLSTDYGDTWTSISESNKLLRNVKSITVTNSNSIIILSNQGVFVSDDLGSTWIEANNGLGFATIIKLITYENNIFAATLHQGIFKTTDKGKNWFQVNEGLENKIILDLVVNSVGQLFAATDGGGVYISRDMGLNWQKINSGLKNLNIKTLAFDNDENLLAGSLGSGIFRSTTNTLAVNETVNSESYFSFPNPFVLTDVINYYSVKKGEQIIELYNSTGNKMETLFNGNLDKGNHHFQLKNRIPSGIYFIRLVNENIIHTKPFIVIN